MANRKKGTAPENLFSEVIQVTVRPAVKKELKIRATIESKTLSCFLREKFEKETAEDYKVE